MQSRRMRTRVTTATGAEIDARHGVPAGQRRAETWKVVHYGPVPRRTDPQLWDFRVTGATASGEEHVLDRATLDRLPHVTVRGDLHCVNGFSMFGLSWTGVPTTALLDLVPPRADVSHVMAWAEYGYSANLRLSDLRVESTLLATGVDGAALTPERGGPLRLVLPHLYAWKGPKWLRAIEYLTEDRRGFWEERGYHNIGDPWSGARYSYQEEAGEGPA
ncbi:DMSO/TMAO reductase YedYZ molybdopterin-dependent catalytic subunit [Actinopolymorpha pittospori]|uniref:DMSO/TMAO reductase YedYZ molybdopterin-dependent catalytic subunit n=1 Tax=Actinopolymorpha pittospori TaxID=648752 RepID=A0A927RG63_9ACTN|nr:DMSO/TMAO reductase YedYZ molybdopterin-dependent catalytic subunit [Actinopolymorpha pittospori]